MKSRKLMLNWWQLGKSKALLSTGFVAGEVGAAGWDPSQLVSGSAHRSCPGSEAGGCSDTSTKSNVMGGNGARGE